MSSVWTPCGYYHETYASDQGWWQTPLLRIKLVLLLLTAYIIIPQFVGGYWLGVANMVGYTAMGALGVQLLIGYTGLITLGHAAFIAVGAYVSTLLLLQFPWPDFILKAGLAYPLSIVAAAIISGLWSVVFGLPSAKVKGFYLILTTMAAQFITVDFILTQYVSRIGGRGQALVLDYSDLKVGPWILDSDKKVYYFMLVLLTLSIIVTANLLRSRVGRAWVAIRDNDIAAGAMGINIIWYKLLSFFVAGAIAGVAGAFWMSNTLIASPESFSWFWSLWLVGVILIGGVGSIHGVLFGSLFMVIIMEMLQLGASELVNVFPSIADFLSRFITSKEVLDSIGSFGDKLNMNLAYIKDMAFGLIICVFLIFEPNGLSYRWWQTKNYFNLWPFSYK